MTARILVGDCRERLRDLPDRSVHCVVTSPPYWSLRDYGAAGQLGLEPTPEAYVGALVEVFREVRRVLRDDGTVWLVLGDSFAGGGPHHGETNRGKSGTNRGSRTVLDRRALPGLKPKDLVGIPWRAVFALQADGWWLRSDVVWAKKNPMPESVLDRPTRAHEYLFLLAKSRRYFYDAEAVREPFAETTLERLRQASFDRQSGGPKDGLNRHVSARRAPVNLRGRAMAPQVEERPHKAGGRNLRSVWHLASEPFKGAHFAVFPTRLVEPCIKAGCPVGGTVLDPFAGAGTTGLVAARHGRNAVLIELNPVYAAMARERLSAAGIEAILA